MWATQEMANVGHSLPDTVWRAHPGCGPVVTFVMVAPFTAQNDHAMLIRAFEGVGGKWKLLLAGTGPGEAATRELVNRLGLESKVVFLGECENIPQLLEQCDAFVLTTHAEGLPLSVLTAMRAGLPVLATDVRGIPDAVLSAETGYLLPEGDVKQLHKCLQKLVSSPGLLRLMGAAGRRRYMTAFRAESGN